MSLAPSPEDVLRFISAQTDGCVLVTLIDVAGSASRAIGSQMGVAKNGNWCGSFTGGCIEAAIVAEALDVLETGRGRIVRFGAGSPYIDIRLPCGGGIDLMFTPSTSPEVIGGALAALDARRKYAVTISIKGIVERSAQSADVPRARQFDLTYYPPLRTIALGEGEDLAAFVRLAQAFGAEVNAVVPAERMSALGPLPGATVVTANSRLTLPEVAADRWTAIVFLFHDRDWEEYLLPQALALDGFYHGAIGSPRTQAARRRSLREAGVPQSDLAKLRRTVGMIPSTRDPATLALSILAELVADYRALVTQTEPLVWGPMAVGG